MAGWLIIGDSILVNLAPTLAERLGEGQILAESGSSYVSWGRTSGDLHDRLVAALRSTPSTVVICLGTNDDQSKTPELIRANATKLIDLIKPTGAKIILVGPFSGMEPTRFYNALTELGVPTIDGYSLTDGLNRVGDGGIHFDRPSYDTLANRLADALMGIGGPQNASGGLGWLPIIGIGAAIGAVSYLLLRD